MVDHLAENDEHALTIVRDIVSTLQPGAGAGLELREPRMPMLDPDELYGIIPEDVRAPYDVHGNRSVLRTALAGTSRARLAYAPDWMLNLSFRPVLRQLAEQLEAGGEPDLGLTPGEAQAQWESNLSEDQRRQVADWRQYDATRPAVDPAADAQRQISGGTN